MRIAMVSEHATLLAADDGPDIDGRHRHIAELAGVLTDLGHEVRVYTRGVATETRQRDSGRHGDSGRHDSGRHDDSGRHLAERWRGEGWQPDLVHAHFRTGALAAIAARKDFPVPVVVTYHSADLSGRRASKQEIAYNRLIGTRADRVVAQCSAEVRSLVDRGVPRRSISLLPSGVDTGHYTPDGPAARRTHPSQVLSVGDLDDRDGHADLVRALRMLPGTAAVIVGGPPAAGLADHPRARELRKLAEEYEVDDRVVLTGALPRSQLPGLYRSADLVACTRADEPYGQVSLEAMACGIPVVGYAGGALTDTVIDGVTGTLVPPRDPRGLARAMRRLLRDPIRRMAFATASIDRARVCYSWQRTAEQLQRLYSDLRTGYVTRSANPAAGAAMAG